MERNNEGNGKICGSGIILTWPFWTLPDSIISGKVSFGPWHYEFQVFFLNFHRTGQQGEWVVGRRGADKEWRKDKPSSDWKGLKMDSLAPISPKTLRTSFTLANSLLIDTVLVFVGSQRWAMRHLHNLLGTGWQKHTDNKNQVQSLLSGLRETQSVLGVQRQVFTFTLVWGLGMNYQVDSLWGEH